jgi:hypothetical protein
MKALAFLLVFIIGVSCSYRTPKINLTAKQSSISYFDIYHLDSLKHLINLDTSEIKKIILPQDVSLKDTTFESEDGSNWNGFVFYRGIQILLFAETTLECKNIIKRITILDSSVVGLNHLTVGAKFRDIRPYLSQTIPSYPDGYFGLKDKSDGNITYFFDIGDNYNLSIGNVKFDAIPRNITISQILLE